MIKTMIKQELSLSYTFSYQCSYYLNARSCTRLPVRKFACFSFTRCSQPIAPSQSVYVCVCVCACVEFKAGVCLPSTAPALALRHNTHWCVLWCWFRVRLFNFLRTIAITFRLRMELPPALARWWCFTPTLPPFHRAKLWWWWWCGATLPHTLFLA